MTKIVLFILCLLQIKLSSTLTTSFNIKTQFLSNFISKNNGYFDLHLSMTRENRKIFKTSSKFLKISKNVVPGAQKTIQIYDFTSTINSTKDISKSWNLPSDNNQKLLLINYDTNIFTLLKEVDALPNRNIFLAKFLTVNGKDLVKIYRCYRFLNNPNSNINEDYLLTWRPNEDSDLDLENIRGNRMNFGGLSLPVAIVLTHPKSLPRLDDFRDQWTDTYSKTTYGPIMKLFAYYNITPEFKVVPDYKHLETGQNKKYILTTSAPYMSKNLLRYINFLKVTPPTKLCYTMRRPPTSFVTTIFTVTFTESVWYALLGTVFILSVPLYFFLNLEARRQDIKGKTSFSVYDLMFIGLEAICQQGTSTDPRSYASRILQVFMFMAFMFLYVAYSANILVLLQSTTALTNERELLEYGVEYAGMNTSVYNYYNPEIAEQIYQTNTKAPKLATVQEAMERIRTSIFATFLEARYAGMYARDHYTDYEVCGLQEFGARYDFGLGYAAIRKDSGYNEIFKVALLTIAEQGFASRHYLRYFLDPVCFSQGGSFEPIGIREIYQSIVLVAIGLVSALIILGLELTLHKVKLLKGMPDLVK